MKIHKSHIKHVHSRGNGHFLQAHNFHLVEANEQKKILDEHKLIGFKPTAGGYYATFHSVYRCACGEVVVTQDFGLI